MVNRKGFTLVELLAVIAILGILSIVAIGAYSGVTNKSKQKAYQTKVSQIETSAAKWAKENNIDRTTSISVNKLVVEGYLTADEVTDNGLSTITNPTNNENMICKMIEIRYKNGEIVTSFDDSKNNCTLAEQALNDSKIKITAYQQGMPQNKASLNTNSNNSFPWTNKAVTLVVSSDTYKDSAQNKNEQNPIIAVSYDYNGNTTDKEVIITDQGNDKKVSNFYSGKVYLNDTSSYYNTINIDAAVIYDGNVVVTYRFKDGSTKSRTVNVRIDKEEATASVIAGSDWVTETQKVTIKLDDGNGSGAKRFYIGAGDRYDAPGVNKVELCDNNNKNCKYEKEYNAPSVGEYNIWTEDMVGNISAYPKNKISVNNVDSTQPSCEFENIGTLGLLNWYTTEVTPKMRTSVAGISGLYFGISKTEPNKESPKYSNYVGYTSVGYDQAAKIGNTRGQEYTCYVKSLAGLKSQKKMTIKVDTTPPKVSISPTKQETYVKSKTITIKAQDTLSGLGKNSRVEYAWSTDSNNEPTSWKSVAIPGTNYDGEFGPTDEKTVTITGSGMTGIYYLWIKKGTITDAAGNVSKGIQDKSARYGPFYFDNTPPSCELQSTGSTGNNGWYISNVDIKFRSTSDADSGVASYGIGSTNGNKTATLRSDTESITYTGHIVDNAGNSNTCSISVKRDTQNPSCTLGATGTSGDNDWYRSDITVKFNSVDDAISGVVKKGLGGVNNSDTIFVNTETNGVTYTGYVEDEAGHTATCQRTYKIDKTSPSCTLGVTNGTKGENGWYTSNVDLEITSHTDSRSGVAGYGMSTNGNANYSKHKDTRNEDTDSNGVTFTGYIKDNAGNTATCGPITVKKDSTPPTCSLSKVCNGGSKGDWCRSTVNISFGTKSDGNSGSGVAAYGLKSDYTKHSDTRNADTGKNGVDFTGYIKDKAGNTNTCTTTVYKDTTAPSSSLCDSGISTSGTDGNSNWFVSDVTVSSKDNDIDTFEIDRDYKRNKEADKVDKGIHTYSDSVTYSASGYHYLNLKIIDQAGNSTSCGKKTIKIDQNNPKLSISDDNPGCPSTVNVKYRKAKVSDATSGLSKSNTDYYIGPTAAESQYNNPVTPNGALSGAEGFCSGRNVLYASWTLCDVAGNCIDGSKSW